MYYAHEQALQLPFSERVHRVLTCLMYYAHEQALQRGFHER